ncbi:MAG: isopentenyl phosphate kinase [Conexivisphaerales archaeon]
MAGIDKNKGVAVIKLGGSFLTDKSMPFKARVDSIKKVADALRGFEGSIAIVHGGGSFGHSVAMKYGLSSSKNFSDSEAIFETRKAMHKLSSIVTSSFEESGLKTYTLPAAGLLRKDKRPRADLQSILNNIMKAKMIPLTFGDVIPYRDSFTIVSGDYLSYVLCSRLRAEKMCFLIDRPGILMDPADENSIIRRLTGMEIKSIRYDNAHDATGGLKAKLLAALKIAELGVQTAILSGFNTDALISFLAGGKVQGTVVKPQG